MNDVDPGLIREINRAAGDLYGFGETPKIKLEAYVEMRKAGVTPLPGPDRCCQACKGSGLVEKKKLVERLPVTITAQSVDVFESYTVACVACGGRGYMMPWQMEEKKDE